MTVLGLEQFTSEILLAMIVSYALIPLYRYAQCAAHKKPNNRSSRDSCSFSIVGSTGFNDHRRSVAGICTYLT